MVTAQITPGRTLRSPRAAIQYSLIPKASVEAHYVDLSEGKSGPYKNSSLCTPEHSLYLVAGTGKKCRNRNQGQLYLFRHNGQSVRAKEQTLEVALGRAKFSGTPVPSADVGGSGLTVDEVWYSSAKSAVSGALDASAIPVLRWDTL